MIPSCSWLAKPPYQRLTPTSLVSHWLILDECTFGLEFLSAGPGRALDQILQIIQCPWQPGFHSHRSSIHLDCQVHRSYRWNLLFQHQWWWSNKLSLKAIQWVLLSLPCHLLHHLPVVRAQNIFLTFVFHKARPILRIFSGLVRIRLVLQDWPLQQIFYMCWWHLVWNHWCRHSTGCWWGMSAPQHLCL